MRRMVGYSEVFARSVGLLWIGREELGPRSKEDRGIGKERFGEETPPGILLQLSDRRIIQGVSALHFEFSRWC